MNTSAVHDSCFSSWPLKSPHWIFPQPSPPPHLTSFISPSSQILSPCLRTTYMPPAFHCHSTVFPSCESGNLLRPHLRLASSPVRSCNIAEPSGQSPGYNQRVGALGASWLLTGRPSGAVRGRRLLTGYDGPEAVSGPARGSEH